MGLIQTSSHNSAIVQNNRSRNNKIMGNGTSNTVMSPINPSDGSKRTAPIAIPQTKKVNPTSLLLTNLIKLQYCQ